MSTHQPPGRPRIKPDVPRRLNDAWLNGLPELQPNSLRSWTVDQEPALRSETDSNGGPEVGDLKDTNPKDAIGVSKVPFSTVSGPVMAEVGLAMMEGALKYGRHNFRVSGVRASVYYDAAIRHLTAFWEGQDIDPDSKLPHIVKVMACMNVLRDSQIQGNWIDDRPPKTPDNWQVELNAHAKRLLEMYPQPVPAHLETDRA